MATFKLGLTGERQVSEMVGKIMDDVLKQHPSMGGKSYGDIQGMMMDMQIAGLKPDLPNQGGRNADYETVQNHLTTLQKSGHLATTKDWYQAFEGLKNNDSLKHCGAAFDVIEEKLSSVVNKNFSTHKDAKKLFKGAPEVFGNIDTAHSFIDNVANKKIQEAKLPDSKKVETLPGLSQDTQDKKSQSLMDRLLGRGSNKANNGEGRS